MLDDLGLVLGGPVADPDPSEVLRALIREGSSRVRESRSADLVWKCSDWPARPHLTKRFRHKYCLRSTSVFTTSMHGTHATARRTRKIWRPFCIFKRRRKNIYVTNFVLE